MTNERCRIPRGIVMLCAGVVLVPMLLTGCGGSAPAMTQGVPPDGWEDDLLAFRQDKDRRWAVAVDSPIHPSDKTEFQGLQYFAPDPAYRVVGPIQVAWNTSSVSGGACGNPAPESTMASNRSKRASSSAAATARKITSSSVLGPMVEP